VQDKGVVRLGVIADTHVPGRGRRLPDAVFELFDGVELILHAGDFIDSSVLHELETIAPTRGVLGNCDASGLAGLLPITDSFDAGGLRIGMIHDSGPRERRRKRMSTAFPNHRVVVFGHSHRPLVEDDGALLLLNPGSACDPRAAKIPTVAILEITQGQPRASLIEL
jgi:uncharacterized protein